MDQMLEHLQRDQLWGVDYMPEDNYADILIDAGPAFSMIDSDGTVWGCAGVQELEHHRAMSWALIREGITLRILVELSKGIQCFLDNTDYARVEAAVAMDFEKSNKWARMLGFKLEGFMHGYFPNGGDAYLYARVK